MNQQTFNKITWTTVFLSLAIVTFAWSRGFDWDSSSISSYQLFPLFGLIAWITMAGHYYLGTVRILNPGVKKPKGYKSLTGYLVLGSILLHPGLLAIEQKENGQGLPPTSFYNYVGDGLKLAVMLGSISLLIFLSFEVFERIKDKRIIKNNWKIVSISQSLAMTLVWVHALRLGGNLGEGWFQFFWFVAGLSLIPCFYIIHKEDFKV
jgi:hypothetical protein